MKALKVIVKILFWTLVVVVAALLALPLWIGPVAKCAVGTVGPKFTGTPVHLGEFSLNPYTGKVVIGDFQVANPPDYSDTNAVDLTSLKVDVAVTSLFSKKLRVEEILLDGLQINIAPSGGNLRTIAKNATGGDSADMGEKKSEEKPSDDKSAKEGGVEIDKAVLANIKIKYLGAPISVPTITLEGIGADKDEGASWSDAWEALSGPVAKAAGIVTGAIGDAASAAVDAAGATVEAAGAAVDAAGAAAGAAVDVAKDATDTVSGVAKGATDAVTGATKGAADAVTGAAKGATDALKNAGDGLKNLFK